MIVSYDQELNRAFLASAMPGEGSSDPRFIRVVGADGSPQRVLAEGIGLLWGG